MIYEAIHESSILWGKGSRNQVRYDLGNGNPLRYSFLENSMDRGAWQAAVPGVTKSHTWLSNWAQNVTVGLLNIKLKLIASSLTVVFRISFDFFFFSMGLVIHFLVFNNELGPLHTWIILYLDYLQKTGLFIFNPSIRFFPTKHFMSRFDLHKSYLSRWLLHPVGEYSYAFPTPHVCSPRELIHCLDKTHDPSKCAQCLHWNWSILWLWWQLDIPAAYKRQRQQPSPSRCCTQFPTLPGLSPPLSQNTWFDQPPASVPCLFPLEQVKAAIGQDPKASKMIIP